MKAMEMAQDSLSLDKEPASKSGLEACAVDLGVQTSFYSFLQSSICYVSCCYGKIPDKEQSTRVDHGLWVSWRKRVSCRRGEVLSSSVSHQKTEG